MAATESQLRLTKLKLERQELDVQYEHCLDEGRLDEAAHVRNQISMNIHRVQCTKEHIKRIHRKTVCHIQGEIFSIPNFTNPKSQLK